MSVKIRIISPRDYHIQNWDDYDRGRVAVLIAITLSAVALCLPVAFVQELSKELGDTMDMVAGEMKDFKDQTDALWDELLEIQAKYGRPPFLREKRMAEFNFLDNLERRSMKGRLKAMKRVFGAKTSVSGYGEPEADKAEPESPYDLQKIQSPSIEPPKIVEVCKPVYNPKCPPGPPGPEGKPGYDGMPGMQGASGADGASFGAGQGISQVVICPDGIPGEPGPKGPKGIPGPPGEPGVPGIPSASIPGPQGEPGEVGEPGEAGLEGLPGKDGEDAIKWVAGEPGEKGPSGAPGEVGLSGPLGEDGVPGSPGLPGQPGESGKDGRPGVEGPPGEPGYPGLSGRTSDAYCPCPQRNVKNVLSKKAMHAASENVPKLFWLL